MLRPETFGMALIDSCQAIAVCKNIVFSMSMNSSDVCSGCHCQHSIG